MPARAPHVEEQFSRVIFLISGPFAATIHEAALKISPLIFFPSDPSHPKTFKMKSMDDLVVSNGLNRIHKMTAWS